MKTSKQLKEERGSLLTKIEELSKTEARTDAQNDELISLFEQRDSLNKAIETQLMVEGEEARAAQEAAKKAGSNGAVRNNSGEEKELRNFSLGKLIVSAHGDPEFRNVDAGFEREVLNAGADQRSFQLPEQVLNVLAEKRTMVTSSATAGGNFVQTDKVGFFEALFNATVLRELGVQYMTGLSSNVDLRGFTASVTSGWASSEVGTQTPSDPTTAVRSLTPKLLYAASNVSKRLLMQTNPSIDTFLLRNMMMSLEQKLEQGVINGAGGSTEPNGMLDLITQIVSMGTNGSAPSYAKILELIALVETSDGRNARRKFLINPKLKSKLKQTELDSGSGAFVMGYNGLFQSQMGVIDGYDTLSTANVPSDLDKGSTTGVCSAMVFGDFSQVVVGQFGVIDLVVDPYTSARTATINYTLNQYVDSTILQPNALGSILDLTTT
jgi:HK97 family phage major capsid protein